MTPAAILIQYSKFLFFALLLSPLLLSVGIARASSNEESCPADANASITAAREALHSQDRSAERTALLCLVEAVAAIDARLSDTLAGRIEFEKITSKAYFPSASNATAEAK